MTYKEQIKHPKWQKKRLEILERDGFKCFHCGVDNKTLHVHHFIYYKNTMIWDYDNDGLVTYCEDCHEEWHYINDILKEWIGTHLSYIKYYESIIEYIPIMRREKMDKLTKFLKGE